MCREGIDLVTMKVALRHGTDRLEQEMDHLKQWAALASNVNLQEVSSMLEEALARVSAAGEVLADCVRALAELQVQRSAAGGSGVTITPM